SETLRGAPTEPGPWGGGIGPWRRRAGGGGGGGGGGWGGRRKIKVACRGGYYIVCTRDPTARARRPQRHRALRARTPHRSRACATGGRSLGGRGPPGRRRA